MQTEEGRGVQFRLVLEPRREQISIRLHPPIPYTVRSIRKISPTIGLQGHFLALQSAPTDEKPDALQIVGIVDPLMSPPNDHINNYMVRSGHLAGRSPLSGVRLTSRAPGALLVQTSSIHAFDYCEGEIRPPTSVRQIIPILKWMVNAALTVLPPHSIPSERLENFYGTPVSLAEFHQLTTFSTRAMAFWIRVFLFVQRAKHGGAFMFVDPRDVPDLVDVKYNSTSGIVTHNLMRRATLAPQLQEIDGISPDWPSLTEELFAADSRLAEAENLIASLASVDGAVVIGPDLNVVGFGARFTQSKDNDQAHRQEQVEFMQNPNWSGLSTDLRPVNEFGMRHTSAFRFCEDVRSAIACVISQDGAVRCFWNRDDQVRAAEVDLELLEM